MANVKFDPLPLEKCSQSADEDVEKTVEIRKPPYSNGPSATSGT
jgi:hypothetical protein